MKVLRENRRVVVAAAVALVVTLVIESVVLLAMGRWHDYDLIFFGTPLVVAGVVGGLLVRRKGRETRDAPPG